jgi:RNA polymerase sigma-70 factor, ECF subfamily
VTGIAPHVWHLDGERPFGYARFPLRSCLAGMRLSNEPISNETLLLRVGGGDRAAFRDLYAATAPRLFAICAALLRERARAEEALQEAFIRVWERAKSFEPDKGTALAWMAVVTRRVALNELRRRDNAQKSLDDADDALPEIAGDLPEQDPIGKGRLLNCLEKLGPDKRRFVLLAYVQGYSHAELARRFEQPLGTMKSTLFRALADLRRCMS